MSATPEKFKALWPSVQSMREMIANSYAANMDASDAAVLTLADEIDRLNSLNSDLLAALQTLLDRYTALVECGDCGNWDVETEGEVIATRAAIAKAVQA